MLNIPEYKDAERVFYYFEEISKIPHGSENTSKIADYLVSFAISHGLSYHRDEANNVIIKKPATEGFEDKPAVIIQGHTDMVAEKLPELQKDMLTEGLDIYRDGDFLRARGTTLGGDDGVAVAYALAILEADNIPHPALEALFTSDEEIGLLGASALDASKLEGKIMINIDSDDEGIFTVGCAGGARVDIELPVSFTSTSSDAYKLTVTGLLGGHSGVEINKGRANAVKLLADILESLGDIEIASVLGGNADNAIPREATSVFTSKTDPSADVLKKASELKTDFAESDPYITVKIEKCAFDGKVIEKASSENLLAIINENKSGVIYMSEDIEGLPESSQNLGIIRLDENNFKCTFSVRSAKASRKTELIEALKASAKKNSASVSIRGEYPAWEYKKDSKLRDTAVKVFSEMYKKYPEVIVIHAGLECGIFSDKIRELDCISLGPDNFDIHTTEEHLSISSTARVYEFLKKILQRL